MLYANVDNVDKKFQGCSPSATFKCWLPPCTGRRRRRNGRLLSNVMKLIHWHDRTTTHNKISCSVTKILEERRSLAKSWLDLKLHFPPRWSQWPQWQVLLVLVLFQWWWWHWEIIQAFLDLCPAPFTEWLSTSCLLGILLEAVLFQLTKQPQSTGRNLRRVLASFLASLTLLFIQVISKIILTIKMIQLI